MVAGGRPLAALERARAARARRPARRLAVHRLDRSARRGVPRCAARRSCARVEPAWVSDHLCWSSVGGHYAHDLLPLPYTEEALAHVVRRVVAVQERLGRRILLENVSSYLAYTHSTLAEWEFLGAVAERADCGLLLDVNNVYVSA